MISSQLIRDAGLDAVIGMHPVVHRLRTTVVNPWVAARRGDPEVRPPHRVLLYGAPGSGVTFIAGRLADELADTAGIEAIVVEHLDDELARDRDGVIAAINGPEAGSVVIVGVSHTPWLLGHEVLRSGSGFERLAFVAPPDWEARRFRLWELPIGSQVDSAALDELVVATEGWVGEDLASLGVGPGGPRLAADDVERLVALATQAVPASRAWFTSVRDLIPEMDSYGRVDDLVGYLQRYRLL